MILKGDVQKALQALIEQEINYWQEHPEEWKALCWSGGIPWNSGYRHPYHDPAVIWDGYHWQFVRALVQFQLWEDLKNYIKGLRETHLKDQILYLLECNAPRLYRELWDENEGPKRNEDSEGEQDSRQD